MTQISRSRLLELDEALHVASERRSFTAISEILEDVVDAVPAGEVHARMEACLHVLGRGELSDYVRAALVSSLVEVSRTLHEILVFDDADGAPKAANE